MTREEIKNDILIYSNNLKRNKMKQETLEEAAEIDLTKLCYYDKRNPDFQIKEEYGYDKEEVEATGNFAKKDCACDNCFYGRSKLTEQLIWQQERMYSEEDLISFYNFLENHQLRKYGDIWKRMTNDPKDKPLNFESVDDQYIIEWFEQFKKK